MIYRCYYVTVGTLFPFTVTLLRCTVGALPLIPAVHGCPVDLYVATYVGVFDCCIAFLAVHLTDSYAFGWLILIYVDLLITLYVGYGLDLPILFTVAGTLRTRLPVQLWLRLRFTGVARTFGSFVAITIIRIYIW